MKHPQDLSRFLSIKTVSAVLAWCCCVQTLIAQIPSGGGTPSSPTGSPGNPVLASASKALNEGFPQIAEQKVRALLSGTLSSELKDAATLVLAESLVDQNQGEDSLKELTASGLADSPAVRFQRARALLSLGKWAEALPLFEQSIDPQAGSAQQSLAATLGRAECLTALGRNREALGVLSRVKQPGSLVLFKMVESAVSCGDLKAARAALEKAKAEAATGRVASQSLEKPLRSERSLKYLESRILLAEGKAEGATEGFEGIVKDPQGIPEGIYAAATLGLTESRIVTGGLENADNVLEDFIWQHPSSTYLEMMFRRLDQIYSQEENASDSELEKWAEKPPQRRAALALYYYACMEMRDGKAEKALRKFQHFVQTYPDHPLVAHALCSCGKLLAGDSKLDAALTAYESAMRVANDPEFLAEIEMLAGIAEFAKKDFVLASSRFHSAAGHSARLWEQATFNSALAWLNQGNFEKFLEDYKEISLRAPESKYRPEMLLEEGLLQARTCDPKAKAALQLFLKDFPSHPRAVEAQLALAELAFAEGDSNATGNYLKVALEKPGSPQTADQAALLEIFQADTLSSTNKDGNARVIDLCLQFLKQRPDSSLTDQVRMKLGQVYFRNEDYANAQTQFETLANEHPNSPLNEPALFLAGQSSMRIRNTGGVDRAIEIFQQVAAAKGPLQLYARQQQAIAYSRLGKEKDAVTLYDEILSASPAADLRFAVLGGKADSLVASAGKDEKLLTQAIAVFDQLATQPDVTASWRNQALYKKAKCLETLGRTADALAVYYDILQVPSIPGSEGPDYTWYYKAGFDLAGALESQEQWKSAIAVYEKLANLLGPSSDEAKKRVDQLRLEHFIWEE